MGTCSTVHTPTDTPTMQCAPSTSLLPLLRTTSVRTACRAASTTSRGKGKGKGRGSASGRSKKQAAAPAPNALTFNEAIRTLRALSPGDTSSAYELTLLPKLAATVNINSLRGRSFLIHTASSAKKKEVILVFAEGEKAEEARREGADVVGGKELIDEILTSRVSPTKIIATPELLPLITRSTLPRFLGPKGLMPSAKRGSVTTEIAKAIQEAKGGLDWMGVSVGSPSSSTSSSSASSADKGMVSVPIARLTFTQEQILQNVRQFSKEVLNVCNGVGTQADVTGSGAKKGKKAEIERMFLSTSQGISIDITDLKQLV